MSVVEWDTRILSVEPGPSTPVRGRTHLPGLPPARLPPAVAMPALPEPSSPAVYSYSPGGRIEQQVAPPHYSQYARPSPVQSAPYSSPNQRQWMEESTYGYLSGTSASPPRQIPPDPKLLAAPPRPSRRSWSRRALTRALELAREAVTLDQSEDAYAAVVAYGQSVALLAEVMDRVRSGESTESRKSTSGKEFSAEDREGEIQRLNDIYNTYRDRMDVLSLVYSIPPIAQQSPPTTLPMTITTYPEEPPSPTTSDSPTSAVSSAPESPDTPDTEDSRGRYLDIDVLDGTESIGSAMFVLDDDISQPGTAKTARFPSQGLELSSHPYAAAYEPPMIVTIAATPPPSLSRAQTLSSLRLRGRASSTLPPPPPPPSNALPPAPGHLNDLLDALPPPSPAALNGLAEYGSLPKLRSIFERTHTMPESPRLSAPNYVDHPLPPLPPPEPLPLLRTRTTSNPANPKKLPSDRELINNLVNNSTASGTIAARRSKASAPASAGSTPSEAHLPFDSPSRLTASSLPAITANSLGMGGRSRATSQPGRRPVLLGGISSPVPPMPGMLATRKASFPSKLGPNAPPSLTIGNNFVDIIPSMQTPSLQTPTAAMLLPSAGVYNHLPTTPTSPLPTIPPQDSLRKPYHLMGLLRTTMTSKTGGYITRRLHVPLEVWSQGGANLPNLLDKVRIVEMLCAALEDVQNTSVEYFGAGNVSSGMALGIGTVGRREGEAWVAKLEEFSQLCDSLVSSFGKKLGVGEGFASKKTTAVGLWTNKFTRRLNTLTNGKNLDSPAAYVLGLTKLFSHAQLLDEHTKALCASPVAPAYAAFSPDIRLAAEGKLKRSSEFFASVVLTFCIRDMSNLLDKYAKKCERWLEE